MTISFLRNNPSTDMLQINDVELEKINSHKVLGLILQDNLKWNLHVDGMVSKGSKRLHIIRVLKRADVPTNHLLTIFSALIRSVLEYCCPVWSTSLPSYLSGKLEAIQRRAFRIIYPDLSYSRALELSGFPRLDARRSEICIKTFSKISTPGSKLSHLIPPTRQQYHGRTLRNSQSITKFKCRTERFRNSFLPSMINNF